MNKMTLRALAIVMGITSLQAGQPYVIAIKQGDYQFSLKSNNLNLVKQAVAKELENKNIPQQSRNKLTEALNQLNSDCLMLHMGAASNTTGNQNINSKVSATPYSSWQEISWQEKSEPTNFSVVKPAFICAALAGGYYCYKNPEVTQSWWNTVSNTATTWYDKFLDYMSKR